MTMDYVIKRHSRIAFTAARTRHQNRFQALLSLELGLMRISVTYRQFIGLCLSNARFLPTGTYLHRPLDMTSNHFGPSPLDRVCLVPARDHFQVWEDPVVSCL